MPSNLFGLPIHILVIHAVVVLLPLAAVTALAIDASGWVRERVGLAAVVGTFVVALLVPVATQTGEDLRGRLPNAPQIARHASLGQTLLIWTAVFGLALALVVALDVYRRAAAGGTLRGVEARLFGAIRAPGADRPAGGSFAAAFLAARVILAVTAVGVIVYVVLAGDSGARAVWDHYPHLAGAP